jgi:hypothetical protein
MPSSSSYILFSQTSRPFGTRDLWGPVGLPGDTAGSVAGLVNGTIADFPLSAFNAFQGTDVQRADWTLLALGPTADAAVASGRVFDAPPGPRNPEATLALDPATAIVVQLAGADWNGIKNLELLLTNDSMIFAAPVVSVRNIVDVRIKIGDDGPAEGAEPLPFVVETHIENVKRGQLDASDSPAALDAIISLTSNGAGWGNTFVVDGSIFDDAVSLRQGDWSAKRTTLDGFRNLTNDGRHSLVVADLGEGNDRFDAGPLVNIDGPIPGSSPVARMDIRMGPDRGSADFVLSPGTDFADGFLRQAQTTGDRLICSDGSDLIRYAAGDGADQINRFDPVHDRIVLEGIDAADVAIFDVLRAGDRFGPAALILFNVSGLPPDRIFYSTQEAILITDVSALGVESALIFA